MTRETKRVDVDSPEPGDWATHKYRELDPRLVADVIRVRPDAKKIGWVFLLLGGVRMGPFEASNYTYLREVEV